MTAKTTIAAVLAVAALGATAGTASANHAWTNSASNIEQQLIQHWNTSDGEAVVEASCRGVGAFYGWHHGKRYFHRFACNEWDDLNRHFGVNVTATGPGNSLRVIQTWCNDSQSDYRCP